MRKNFLLAMFLICSAAWLIAQEPSTGAPAGSSGQSTTQTAPNPPATPATPASPDAPGATAQSGMSPTMNADVVEGCLGGVAPNYTVADKSGTTYKLIIPPAADASVLAKHIGESVQVMGNITGSGASSAKPEADAGSSTAPSSSKTASIQVMRIGRGHSDCPAGGPSGATGASSGTSGTSGNSSPSTPPAPSATPKPPKQ